MADDLGHRGEAADAAQDALADDGVLGHHRALVGRQRAGLVEDRVGDADLADVVQQRRRADVLDLGRREPEAARHGDGHLDDRLGVLARVAVALEQGDRERLDGVAAVQLGGDAESLAVAARRSRRARRRPPGRRPVPAPRCRTARRDRRRRRRTAPRPPTRRCRGSGRPRAPADRPAAVRRRRSSRLAGLAQEQREAVGAGAADHVLGARARAQRLDEGGEQRVAGREAMVTVDVGDAVDLQHDERAAAARGGACAAAPRRGARETTRSAGPWSACRGRAASAPSRVGDSFPGSFQLAREPVAVATDRHRNMYRPAGRRA